MKCMCIKYCFKMMLIIIVFLLGLELHAENGDKFGKAIEDNSYLLEEAYNQELYVVQHSLSGGTSLNFKQIK